MEAKERTPERIMKVSSLLLVLLLSCLSQLTAFGAVIKGNIAGKYLYEGKEENTAVVEYMEGVDLKSSSAPKVVVFYSPYCG